ncbi:hypothetical protein [Leuconostoc gasicomitatum]|uniref:hypothetical protein n=1 Tax=Leuconostoc gasicomitatum TaxID=115778 RepID=UPI0007E0C751|nr:hypothetical protein [Leuconostoc gasicomitatum]CUW14759.1 hypothetical protein PB1E_1659 [Leuconostoc gasicomitatum]
MSDDLQAQTDIFNVLSLQTSGNVQNEERSFLLEPTILQIGRDYSIAPNIDEFDVLFYEMAGNSLRVPDLQFTNFDNEFPSHTTIKKGFDFICKDIKLAILKDTKWIKNYDTYQEHFLPILKKHIPNYSPAVLNYGEYTEFIESRIHEDIEKGSFRIFSKYVTKESLWSNGGKVEKSTLIVLLYDPFHLVFIDEHQQGIGMNTNTYNLVKDYGKTIKSAYYRKIPNNLRINVV